MASVAISTNNKIRGALQPSIDFAFFTLSNPVKQRNKPRQQTPPIQPTITPANIRYFGMGGNINIITAPLKTKEFVSIEDFFCFAHNT